jgi:hypothetical protein
MLEIHFHGMQHERDVLQSQTVSLWCAHTDYRPVSIFLERMYSFLSSLGRRKHCFALSYCNYWLACLYLVHARAAVQISSATYHCELPYTGCGSETPSRLPGRPWQRCVLSWTLSNGCSTRRNGAWNSGLIERSVRCWSVPCATYCMIYSVVSCHGRRNN